MEAVWGRQYLAELLGGGGRGKPPPGSMNSPGRQFTLGLNGSICDVSGLGTPCSTAAATAPPPTAPLVAAAEMAKCLLSEELELGRESDVYPMLLSSLGVRGRRLMYL